MAEETKLPRTPRGTFPKGVSGNKTGKAKTARIDGWSSAITGIGNALHDKRESATFCPSSLPYDKCIEIYEGDPFGRKAAQGPVDDAFRQGYEISIADEGEFDDLKEDIENEMRELDVDCVIKKALIQKRVLGGSAILIGVRDNKSMDRPMDRKKISKIEFLTNLEPMDIMPDKYYDDPLAPKYGEVELWRLQRFGQINSPYSLGLVPKTAATEKQNKSILIHESRLIVFNQERLSNYSATLNATGVYWGLSIYSMIYEILRDFNMAWSAAGLLVTDFSQAVFSIEGLMQLVIRDEQALTDRMKAMNMGRSVARAILVDTNEKFERQSTNLTGLPDLLTQLSKKFAAAIGYPLSVLMSSGGKADQAEMGDDLRYYYDQVGSMQRDEITPTLRLFADIIMRGLRQRKIPKKWGVKWHPLWQLTDEQKANARLAQARVDAIYVKHGVLDPQVVAKIRFGGEYSFDTALPPSYKAPGFMALPPLGVVVDGMDPKTGLPPGVQPPPAGGPGGKTNAGGSAHAVAAHARGNPRHTSMAGGDTTAGGDTIGKIDSFPEDIDDDLHHDPEHPCGQRHCTVCQ